MEMLDLLILNNQNPLLTLAVRRLLLPFPVCRGVGNNPMFYIVFYIVFFSSPPSRTSWGSVRSHVYIVFFFHPLPVHDGVVYDPMFYIAYMRYEE